MSYATITGYTYEADTHCQECAEKRFGAKLYGNVPVTDREGNDVHPMYSFEEHGYWDDENPNDGEYHPATCSDCLEELV